MKNKPYKWSIPAGVTASFYEWTVLSERYDFERRMLIYVARCSCGKVCNVIADQVRRGKSRRCRWCSAAIAGAAKKNRPKPVPG